MGRAIGLPVRPASMKLASEAEARSDLWVVSTHMVAIYRKGPSVVVFDFDRGREGPPVGLTPRDDLWLNAVHLNNRGVEELVGGRPAVAAEVLGDAVLLAPRFAEAWGNLGVARRRSGDIEGAFDAYLLALQIQPRSHVIRGNVATLYGTLALRREEEANANPETDPIDGLLLQGFEAMAGRDVEAALKLFRRAHRQAPDRVEPLVALARAKLYQGRPRAAGKKLDEALLLDTSNSEARELMESIRRAGYY
jgi:Flp pilus assembly protein TadD